MAPNNAVREKLLSLDKLSCAANCSLVCFISPTLIMSLWMVSIFEIVESPTLRETNE